MEKSRAAVEAKTRELTRAFAFSAIGVVMWDKKCNLHNKHKK
jgi:hypothetical protein